MANYLLVRRLHSCNDFYDRLLKEYHIAVRNCGNFRGLDENYFRIGLRTEEENDLLAAAVGNVLDVTVKPSGFYLKKQRRKPSLMLQGTCSNAGKSILTAAFCRILLQDGYDVAPFKAQNMALNSYVTLDGCEMGRAQAVQAEACRLSPDVRMNPVLLKPSSDTGSQVIVLGKPVANMEARKYYTAKTILFDTVKSAYDSLEKDHEVIVLEGAGSPGEMNLKHADIVNMNMARYAESPVLLAGDIDRGGVYASFIGTVETFEPWERDLLKGFIVNKFRGDASLLTAAHDYVYNFTGKPVLGVVPYLKDLGLPEEDSVSFSFTRPCEKFAQTIDVALIALDHIANFTDFTPFEIEPDVNVRKVRKLSELGNPDLIILPGSKNVIGDMEVLRRNGLDTAIKDKVKGGAWLAGICGGLQLAGEIVEDPHGLESASKTTAGLGLLPLRTILEKEKILRLTKAVLTADNRQVSGYEIHHGITECGNEQLISMRTSTGEPVGFAAGKVWVTYLHGVFDDDLFRREFIDMIRSDRGLPPLHKVCAEYSTENALNRLADTVRGSVNLREIYKIMGLD
jgi:cobyric acid synthase CobQ